MRKDPLKKNKKQKKTQQIVFLECPYIPISSKNTNVSDQSEQNVCFHRALKILK